MKGKKFEWTPELSKRLRELPDSCLTVGKVCKALNVPRSTLYEERNRKYLLDIKRFCETSEEALLEDALDVTRSLMHNSNNDSIRLASARIIIDRFMKKEHKTTIEDAVAYAKATRANESDLFSDVELGTWKESDYEDDE